MMIYRSGNIRRLKGFFNSDNGLTQLLVVLFVAFSSLLVLFGFECAVLWIIYRPASLESFNALMTDNISLLKLSQAVQAVGLFIVPAFAAAFLLTKTHVSDYLRLNNTANFNLYALVALAAIVLLPLVNAAGTLNEAVTFPPFLQGFELWARALEEAAGIQTEQFLSVSSIDGLLLNILIIAMLAAIGEELIFRGVLQRIFTNWAKSEISAIWITALVFSAVHFQFFGFLPRLLLGAYFGYLLVWTRTVWVPVLAHFVHNAAAVLAFYLHHNGCITVNPDDAGSGGMLWLSIPCGILFAGVAYLIKRNGTAPEIRKE